MLSLSPGTRRDGSGLVWSDVPRAPTSIIPCHSHSHTQTLPDKLFCLPSRSLARPLIGGMGPLGVSSLLGGNLSLQLETWAYLWSLAILHPRPSLLVGPFLDWDCVYSTPLGQALQVLAAICWCSFPSSCSTFVASSLFSFPSPTHSIVTTICSRRTS